MKPLLAIKNLSVVLGLTAILLGYLLHGVQIFPFGTTSAIVSAFALPVLYGAVALFLIEGRLATKIVLLNTAPCASGTLFYLIVTSRSAHPEARIQFAYIALYILIAMVVSTIVLSAGFGVRDYFFSRR